jgi:hypothetical protein
VVHFKSLENNKPGIAGTKQVVAFIPLGMRLVAFLKVFFLGAGFSSGSRTHLF